MICKYPPIQGGVSAECYWTAQLLAEMGHEINVLTNAQEVEDEYRINLNPEDVKLLNGFRKVGLVRVISTTADKRHVFVPQNNPSVSKLLSLGLELVEVEKPDFIWSHYLEPYGVVAYLLSKLTGIPYIFRHAGSDIGRLIFTSQLRTLHNEVLRNALFIMTHSSHHGRFLKLGIPADKLVRSVCTKLRPGLFFPISLPIHSPMTLGVYGKTGESKGTGALLDSISLLKEEGFEVKIKMHWGGRDTAGYLLRLRELGIEDVVEVNGFIPHWRIPDFIRSCGAVFFLENRFSVSFHHPSVPLEVVSCGRPIITTAEVANKPFYKKLLVDGENAFVIQGEVTGESIAVAVRRVTKTLCEHREVHVSSTPANSEVRTRISIYDLLEKIQVTLQERRTPDEV